MAQHRLPIIFIGLLFQDVHGSGLSATQRGNFTTAVVPNVSNGTWAPRCPNLTIDNFLPECLPLELYNTNDTALFKLIQTCGLQAGVFQYQNLKPTSGINHTMARTVFFNIVVAVVHFLLAAMAGTIMVFRKRTFVAGDDESPLAIKFCGPMSADLNPDDLTLEKTEKEVLEAGKSLTSKVMGHTMNIVLPLAGVVTLLMALGTALTSCGKLAACMLEYVAATGQLDAPFLCRMQLKSKAAQFGDTATMMALSTFTLVDLLPLLFGAGSICCLQCCNGVLLVLNAIWNAICLFFVMLGKCLKFVCCCEWCKYVCCICIACWHAFVAEIMCIWNQICCCGCIVTLKECFAFLIRCGPCCACKNLCLLQVYRWELCCSTFCNCSNWSINCCCTVLSSMPYLGVLLPAAAMIFGLFLFGGIALYGVLGSVLYLAILFFVVVVVFCTSTLFAWLIFVVLWVLSQPTAWVGVNKDLKWRGLKRFGQEFLSKLFNHAISKGHQEKLAGLDQRIKQDMKDKFAQIRKEIQERKAKEEERKKNQKSSGCCGFNKSKDPEDGRQQVTEGQEKPATEATEEDIYRQPLLRPGQMKMTLGSGFNPSEPIQGSAEDHGRVIYWKPQDQDHWYEVNPSQTPQHYCMHEGDSLAAQIPDDGQNLVMSALGAPNADACKDPLTNKPRFWNGVAQQLKKISSSWYLGMIVGPLVLFFVLGASKELPRMMSNAWLVGADQGWLQCGPFSIPPHECLNTTAGSTVISGCECLACDSFDPVNSSSEGYHQQVCGPIVGGCKNQGDCFGIHKKDWSFYVDLTGFCSCSANELIWNQTVLDMAVAEPIDSSEWLEENEHVAELANYLQWQSPPPALQILSADWAAAKFLGGEVNGFLYFLFVDTVLAYFAFAVGETHAMMHWLTTKFYKVETLTDGVLGWLHKNNNATVQDTQVGVLAGRAGIAAAVGGISAIHHH